MNAQELLTQYLQARGSEARDFVEPLADEIRKIIRRALSKREAGDLEDFEEDCLVAVWARVEGIQRGAAVEPIENIEAFVRRTVHNRYCDAIRRKRPSWYNLKLELLETFGGKLNVRGFSMWQSLGATDRLCGFSEWRGRSDSAAALCRELGDDPAKFLRDGLANRDPAEFAVPDLCAAVLNWIGGPVEIDTLTSCLASLLHIRDVEPLSIDTQPADDEDFDSPVDWLITSDTDIEQQVVGQDWLEQVITWFWTEFQQLNPRQRKAVFFGLAAEQAIAIAASCGMEEVADAIEIDASRLAELFRTLPLPDAVIAEMLQVPPRSVPSVRFKAWRRIQRRAHKSQLRPVE